MDGGFQSDKYGAGEGNAMKICRTTMIIAILFVIGIVVPYAYAQAVSIYDWNDLNNVRNDPDGDYVLMNDINESSAGYGTYNSGSGWNPIADFSGSLDGQYHVISGLTIKREYTSLVGLFGYTAGATISKIGLEDVDIVGGAHVGAFVGTGNSVISESYATGTVTGGTYVGGFIGSISKYTEDEPYIVNSYSLVDVYASNKFAGGMAGSIKVGYPYNSIEDSYAAGAVDSGSGNEGGLLGGFYDGAGDQVVLDSYWDVPVTGQSFSAGGGTGLTTAEMQDPANFSGWDGSIWKFEAGSYPVLWAGGSAVPELPPFAAQALALVFGSVSVWVRAKRKGCKT